MSASRALFNLGKAAVGGIALHGGSQAECRSLHRHNVPAVDELRASHLDKADEGFLDVFRKPDGTIEVTELELKEASDYVLQHMVQPGPTPAAASGSTGPTVSRPTYIEEVEDDATSYGSAADTLMQDLERDVGQPSQPNAMYATLVRASARMMSSPDVQAACFREMQRDPELRSMFTDMGALPPPPQRFLLEASPVTEADVGPHPLAELLQEVGAKLEQLGEKLKELGRGVGLLFALIGQRLRLFVQGRKEKALEVGLAADRVGSGAQPTAEDGIVGGLVTLGTLLFAIALVKRARA